MEKYRKGIALLARVLSLLVAAAAVVLLLAAPEAVGQIHPDVYKKTFLGGPGLGIHWVYMTGPVETTTPGIGIPGGLLGVFCTHPKMAGGGDTGYTQYYNDEPGANSFLNAIISLSGMNARDLSELRYCIALGLANNLMETQSAYWSYLNFRRPDLFDVMETQPFEMNPANITRWFGSKPGAYQGLAVPDRTGLFIGDKAPLQAAYLGPGGPGIPATIDATGTGDAAGPFNIGWNTADPAFSPALAQINYGPDGNQAPEFTVTTPYCRLYAVNPNTNPNAQPVGSVKLGQQFWVKYAGPARAETDPPLEVAFASAKRITTEVVADRFFYCYVAEYQYTVQLKREPYEFKLGLKCKGRDPTPPKRPRVEKGVTQWDKATNTGPFEDMITVPVGSDSLYKMTLANPIDTDIVYKFGYRDLTVRDDETGSNIYRVNNATALRNAITAAGSDKKIKLTGDITLPDTWTPVNLAGTIIDGAGHTISNAGTLGGAVFDRITGNSALNSIGFNINVKYAAARAATNTGAIAVEMGGCELRNIHAQGSLEAALAVDGGRKHLGFVCGQFTNAGANIVNGLTVDARVTKTGPGDDCAIAPVAGDILGTALSDVRILESTVVRGNSGQLMGFGTLGAGNTTAYNIAVENISFINDDRVAQLYGIGWLCHESRLERFSVQFRYTGAEPNWLYGIGDVQNGSVSVSKGQVSLSTSAAYACCGGVGGHGGSDRVVNISEVHVNADLSGYCAAGIAAMTGSLRVNIDNCHTQGSVNGMAPDYQNYYSGGIYGDVAGNNAINITNCWSSMSVGSTEGNDTSKIMSLGTTAGHSGAVGGCYAFGDALAGSRSRYIFAERGAPPSAVTGADNFRAVDSAASPTGQNTPNGEILGDSDCRGANAIAQMGSAAGGGWDIGAPGSGKIWETVDGGYPQLSDSGYRPVQVVYVHDYYYDQNNNRAQIGVPDLEVYEGGAFKDLRQSGSVSTGVYPRLYPQPAAPDTVAHIFVPAGGSFEFYLKKVALPVGTFHNIVYLTPECGFDWPGDEDDAWVEVRDHRAKLNIVKMLFDTDYLTTLDGCAFRLTQYNNLTFSGTGTALETISPRGMEGATFAHEFVPGNSYIIREMSAPANMTGMVGREWYVVYTDIIRVYDNILCGPEDEITEIGMTAALSGNTTTTIYSFKIINEYDTTVKRGKLRVIKYNEDGSQQIPGRLVTENGVTRWTGAMYAVLRCNTNTGADADFTGPTEAFGHILLCGHATQDSIDLPPGRYVLMELKAPDGYALDTTPYWITVSGTGIVTIVDKHAPGTDQVNYQGGTQNLVSVIDCSNSASVTVRAKDKKPDYQLQIKKVRGDIGAALPDIDFVVTGTDGTTYGPVTFTTGPSGLVVIDFPQPNGSYIITETAPAAFSPIPPIYVQTVDGELFLWGGPAAWAKDSVVVVPGGYVYSKSGIEYTRVYDDELAAMGLKRIENSVVARAHIEMAVKNFPRTSGQLYLTKEVTGGDTDKPFTFRVNFTGPGIGAIQRDGEAYVNNSPFTLKHGETAVFTDIPLGTAYTITENDYAGEGYTCDQENNIAAGAVTKESPLVTVTFKNTYNTGQLVLKKLVEGPGADLNKGFVFTVTFTGPGAGGIKRDGGEFSSGAAVTLRHDQEAVFTDIPYGMAYNIEEADYSAERYVTSGGPMIRAGTVTSANKVVTVTYTNTYRSLAEIDIPGNKTISPGAPGTETFHFLLQEVANGRGDALPEPPPPFTAQITGAGTFSFKITGLDEGEYWYKMTEVLGTSGDWIYDPAEYIIKVTVTRVGGQLLAVLGDPQPGTPGWQHSLPDPPEPNFNTGASNSVSNISGYGGSGNSHIFEVKNGSGTFYGCCADNTKPVAAGTHEFVYDSGMENTAEALAVALSNTLGGARFSLEEFNALFDTAVPSDNARYFSLMQPIVWMYESKLTNPSVIARDISTWSVSIASWIPATLRAAATQVLDHLEAMTAAYEDDSVTGQAVTSLALQYDPVTGRLVFGHVGYQPAKYMTELAWSGDVAGLTVVIDGTTYANAANTGVSVTTASDIHVTYTGSGSVTFTLKDSQNYLKKGSVRGELLWPKDLAVLGCQPVLLGHAEFVNLLSTLEITAGEQLELSFDNQYGIPFEFQKTNRGGAALAGVEFALYKCGNTAAHTHDPLAGDAGACWGAEPVQEAASGPGGMVSFGPLVSGDYMLVETKTKSGYQLPFGQWLVHVDLAAEPEITITARGDTPPPAFRLNDEEIFTVINYPRFTMPRSGSISLLVFAAGGMALTGAAGFLLVSRRRRRKA